MLEIKHVSVAYREKLVLRNISVTIERATFAAIVGPNGAGKTTLLKAVLNIIPRVSGVITFAGKPMQHASVAYIPQRAALDWDFPLSVLDLVLMGTYKKLRFFERPGTQEKEQAYEALAQVGLTQYASEHIGVLSGGQQQRALLARALVQNADLYLLDEPLAGIDTLAEQKIVHILKQLSVNGKTVLMVHHQINQLSEHIDTVLLLNGTCIGYGPVAQCLIPELLAATYQLT